MFNPFYDTKTMFDLTFTRQELLSRRLSTFIVFILQSVLLYFMLDCDFIRFGCRGDV